MEESSHKKPLPPKINPRVFGPSAAIIFALVAFTAAAPELASSAFGTLQQGIVQNMSWFYVLTVTSILILSIYLAFSRYGKIKLGPEHAKPDYSFRAWLAMLFSAGMGIGLMFFGVSEPIMHYLSPPTAPEQSVEAVRQAMKITFFHWGLHAWSIYAVVGLILAFFSYRHRLPLTFRSALFPLIGNKIYGWPGHAIDCFATIGTVFGVATSLGFGAAQVNSGMHFVFGIEESTANQLIIMASVTSVAAISVATGIDRGIKILSELNMLLAIALMLLIFILGPSVFLLQAYIQNIGSYLSSLIHDSFNLFAYEPKEWIGGWTIFYWGWWLSWAPFVGLFIARISRGRTIKVFISGVIILPSLFTFLWMTIFGNGALYLVFNQGVTDISSMVAENTSVALFVYLSQFPWSTFLTMLSMLMIVVFFITSCDSGAMVVDMLCSNGRSDTPVWQRIFWAFTVGLVAAVLTLMGGLKALQTMTIAAALPFACVLIITIFGLLKSLKLELTKEESHINSSILNRRANVHADWRARLESSLDYASEVSTQSYLKRTVEPAVQEVIDFFLEQNIHAELLQSDDSIQLRIQHGQEQDFSYSVKLAEFQQPEFSYDTEVTDDNYYFRAEVHLNNGGQDYDIMGWSKNALINDIVDQYQRHLHFLQQIR